LDDPDLALRLAHRGVCLFDALQMVPSGNVMQAILSAIRTDSSRGEPARSQRRQDCLHHARSCARQLFDV
jgi:hypothetical protein